jgi:hypothetical protein
LPRRGGTTNKHLVQEAYTSQRYCRVVDVAVSGKIDKRFFFGYTITSFSYECEGDEE